MQKHFIKFFAGIALFGACFFAGCSNALTERESADMTEYGSLVIGNGARAVDVSELTSAVVTVSGYGMVDIAKSSVSIENGSGKIQIDNIPVGKNRIVSVKSNVDGVLIRQIVDISANTVTPVSVTWSSTPLASVYYNLLKSSYDISNFGEEENTKIDSMLPKGVHPSLIDYEKISSDFKTGIISANYILDFGTVSVTTSDVSGYTVQVTDVSSEKKTISSSSESFELRSYPGSWKVIVYDENGTEKAKKDINVVAGETSSIDISMTSGEPYDFTGKTIVFVKASSAPDIWAWEDGGVSLSSIAGGTWNTSSSATKMTAATSEYMANLDGWYMIDYSSLATGKTIKFKLNWSDPEITGKAGTFWYDGSSSTTDNPSPVSGEKTLSVTVTSAELPPDSVKIYVSADSAPSIWVWQPDGLSSTELMKYSWSNQPVMENATDLNYSDNWYVFVIAPEYYTAGKTFTFILNSTSGDIESGKVTTFWYDAKGVCGTEKAFYDSDPTEKPVPVVPAITFKPVSGSTIKTTGSFSVTFTNGYDTISSAKVTINGTELDMGTTAGTFTKTLEELGITEDAVSINVSATVTNGIGTTTESASYTSRYIDPSKEDPFTWDNVNAYFVLTDRFFNGDTANDHSYYRQNADNNTTLSSGYNNVATFHGGDIKGLTEKLDYLNRLGVNAIWITAPYEQVHGWCSGGGNGFPHYAFHGYYTQDWTYMDQNMGTIEEFRTFVDEAHKRGIRVVMDVVMNHTGYNTVEDMLTYDFGNFSTTPSHGWIGSGTWKDNHTITNYSEQGKWGNWWGCWVRAFGDQSWASSAGYASVGSGDITGPLSGLPDIVTEKTESVSIPTFLKTKWNAEGDSVTVPAETGNTCGNKYGDYKLPSVSNVDWYSKSGDWRTDGKGAPADYQIVWLSGWVREFGIDGFRCDTAKHIDMYRWGQLKVACQSALEKWRVDSTKADSANAKNWDESFWMTGECFGWTSIEGQGEYYTTGGFDSMIGFDIGGDNHWENSSYSYYVPSITESTWSNYLSINNNDDSDSNGNRNNVLTYISSHDTRLSRTSDQKSLGTMFTLLPGGVQIYYGDETSREKAYTDCGDGDMATRGDFNWDAENGETAVHWGKVGTFRKYNPAVGAGVGSGTKRTYSGSAGESKVAIGISGTSVDVSDLFADGTTVYNWYDGNSNTVSGGTVTFAGGTTSQPILVSEKNPADYGITF